MQIRADSQQAPLVLSIAEHLTFHGVMLLHVAEFGPGVVLRAVHHVPEAGP